MGYFYYSILSINSAAENSGSEALKSSEVVPPPTVLDRVLKDLFHEGTKFCPFFGCLTFHYACDVIIVLAFQTTTLDRLIFLLNKSKSCSDSV